MRTQKDQDSGQKQKQVWRYAQEHSTRRQRQEFKSYPGLHCKTLPQRKTRREGNEKKISQIMNNIRKVNADPHNGSKKKKWCSENLLEKLEIKSLHRNIKLKSSRYAYCRSKTQCGIRAPADPCGRYCAGHTFLLSTVFCGPFSSSRNVHRLER